MSSAGRLTLTDATLASLPTYVMGLFLLADGTHEGFRKHMANFFWGDTIHKRKYHMVSWPEVCHPKDQGGLEITNTKVFNIALMTKWIWRLFNDDNQNSLWRNLLRAKYPGADNIFMSNALGGSQFWRSLHKIKSYFKLGAKFLAGSGTRILFWQDWWTGESPLCTRYARLFDISTRQDLLLAQAHSMDGWRLNFRRSFGEEERNQWQLLLQEIALFFAFFRT